MAKYNIFFGTYSKGEGNGLFCGEFDEDSGGIRLTDSIDIENPSYLQLNGSVLYGVSETETFEGRNGGALFAVDVTASKKMRLLDIKCTHGKHPCHLCVKDKFIFTANYSEGSLSVFEIDGSGAFAESWPLAESWSLSESWQCVHHFGKSVNKNRQEASHVHFAAMTPNDKYLAVCDLGLDKVFLYPYSGGNGISTNAVKINCPSGTGPRHLVFSKCGNYLYVLTELGNTVLVYKWSGGTIQLLQEISTLPPDFTGRTAAAAIHISPDVSLLAASNRGHDSIAIFKISGNGELALIKHLMTGREPRDFRFSPNGRWILSGNQNDNSVTVYPVGNDYVFSQTCSISLPKPVCILFGGAQ